jgi:GNAT superfamily N-acetyltransferase
LLLTAIGSFIAFGVARARTGLRDHRLQRLYPVGGRFYTCFEDHEEGATVWRKAVVELRQRGRGITGTATNLDGERRWAVEATVSRTGHVSGTYTASNPHDTGNGSLFLSIDEQGDMSGLWAGYDSVNKDITSGQWIFRKRPSISIAMATPDDVAEVVALLGGSLGALYIDRGHIEELVAGAGACLTARAFDGQLVGAVSTSVVAPDELAELFPIGQAELLDGPLSNLKYHSQVGIIESIAVDPTCRGRGVGTELVEAVEEWLRDQSATSTLSFGWKTSSGCHVGGVLDASGFSRVLEVSGFWTIDSATHGYSCPEDGNPCHCSAIIFTHPLHALRAAVRPPEPRAIRNALEAVR